MPNPKGPILRDELFPGSELAAEELEFIAALERFKKRYQRRFPSWSEVLLVLKSLGYRRVAVSESSHQQVICAPKVESLAATIDQQIGGAAEPNRADLQQPV